MRLLHKEGHVYVTTDKWKIGDKVRVVRFGWEFDTEIVAVDTEHDYYLVRKGDKFPDKELGVYQCDIMEAATGKPPIHLAKKWADILKE